ncbi:MAG: Clp1/GlmU family protein [Fervidicoccaceae archaeon]
MKIAAEKNGEYYWIKGPASISIEEGKVEINGAVFNQGEKIIVHSNRSYTFLLHGGSSAEVLGGAEFEIDSASREDIIVYENWKKKASELMDLCKKGECRVVVIGEVDSGKTSFATMIANTFLLNGKIPILIDADLGQNTLGLPGFIAMGKFNEKSIWPRELGWDFIAFLGRLSPRGVESELILQIKRMSEKVIGHPLIIDTDGWISGSEGESYKYRLISNLSPTIVIAVGEISNTLESLISGEAEIVKVGSPPRRARRDREERRLVKGEKILKFLSNASKRIIDLRNTPLFFETKMINRSFAALESKAEDGESDTVLEGVRGKADLEGRICALIGKGGWVRGIGIIEGLRRWELLVRTNYFEDIKIVQIGYIKLAGNTLIEFPLWGGEVARRAEVGRGIYKDRRKVRGEGKGFQ